MEAVNEIEQPQKPKKAWYKVWWKSFLGFLTISGIVWGIFEVVIKVNKEWENYQSLQHRVAVLEKEDQDRDNKIEAHDNYIAKKKKSFAVGFRVVKVYDEELEKWVKIRKYRGWDGKQYEVHRDEYYSNLYGYDYYFYIDDDGEKRYCY